MIRNYFTLYHVAQELHEQLAGGYLFEIHSQERNELTLGFVTPEGKHLQLIVTVRSREFSIWTREGLNRKRRNSAGVMKQLNELQVTGVSMAPRDREIRIAIEGEFILVIRFFSADTNVLLVHAGHVSDAFKDARELVGTPWEEDAMGVPRFRSLERIAGDEGHFMELLQASGDDVPLEKRLASSLPGFDLDLARRLIARSNNGGDSSALFDALGGMLYELASPTPCVVETPGLAPEFSILEPAGQSESTAYDEVIDALNHYTRRMYRYLQLRAGADNLRKELQQQIARTSKELASLESAGLTETAERYETFGHLLTGAIGRAETASGEVTVPNLFDPELPEVTIPVRQELNMQENAASYFRRAAKSREKKAAAESRRALLDDRLRSLRLKLGQLDDEKSEENLGRLVGKIGTGKKRNASHVGKQEDRQARFRTVPLSGDITLYIGKDARNNERLTFGLAKPDDIWLHAQGSSGSHCVLRGAGMQNLSEIRRAAEIAAWYSAARTSSLVPVMYTLKKYVRKAKGAIGSVLVEREKVLMVKPRKE